MDKDANDKKMEEDNNYNSYQDNYNHESYQESQKNNVPSLAACTTKLNEG